MLLKKMILLAFICAYAAVLAAQAASSGHPFLLTANINGHIKLLQIPYPDKSGQFITDTCRVVKDSFGFSGFISGPVMAKLSSGEKIPSAATQDFTLLFLEPTL